MDNACACSAGFGGDDCSQQLKQYPQEVVETLKVKIIGGNSDQFCGVDATSHYFVCKQSEEEAKLSDTDIDVFANQVEVKRDVMGKQ